MVVVIQQQQFTNYIKQYERLIITICMSFTKNYFESEDLAQQTFLAAYKNYKKFDGKNFKAWITTIAVNKCKDYIKSHARKTERLSYEEYQLLESKDSFTEDIVMQKYDKKRIYNLFQKLKEPYKTVAINYFYKDIKLSDMARSTGQKLKTLQTQLYRSKKLLKVLWEEEFK